MKKILQRLARLDHLIRMKGTGSPSEFAEKLGISERSLYDHLNILRDYGAPVKFSRQRKSYYYESEGQFYITFQ